MNNTYFSKLLLKHCKGLATPNLNSNTLSNHPFYFLESILKQEMDLNSNQFEFEHLRIKFQDIESKKEAAWQNFNFEINILYENQHNYLNELVTILTTILNKFRFKLNQISPSSTLVFTHTVLKIGYNQCDSILNELFNRYKYLLNPKNKRALISKYSATESINSFKFIKKPHPNQFKKLYEEYLKGEFVEENISWELFSTLFDGKELVQKINWKDSKASLYFFIVELKRRKIIENPGNRHWKITAEFFLLKGTRLSRENLTNHKPPERFKYTKGIRTFLSSLYKP